MHNTITSPIFFTSLKFFVIRLTENVLNCLYLISEHPFPGSPLDAPNMKISCFLRVCFLKFPPSCAFNNDSACIFKY